MTTPINLFETESIEKNEIMQNLLKHQNVTINKIVSPPNFQSDVFCQDEDEWVVIIQGDAVINIGEKEQKLQAGDSVFIPKKTEHRILDTSKEPLCIWMAIHIK